MWNGCGILTDVVAYDNDYHSQFVKYPRPSHPTRKIQYSITTPGLRRRSWTKKCPPLKDI